ncbi:MAG: RNA-protein complex protein Nop10 [Methanobacteriaceae archaeon]
MKLKMKRCVSCSEYTIQDHCPHCGGDVRVIYPPKYSPEDKYGKYRRMLKEQVKDLSENSSD